MTAPLLSLVGVSKTHLTDGQATRALKDVTLDISLGEYVSIVGPSGAGKSTLLNVLGLLETPTEGDYLISGQSLGGLSESARNELRAKTFGFVFQSSHILANESVARNAALAVDMQDMPRRSQVDAVDHALSALGLRGLASKRAKLLSGGERQRLAIARAIASRPLVVLADEPTGNLDRANSRNVLKILESLNRDGVTLIVITHDEEVAEAADRTIRIEDGQILADVRRRVQEPVDAPGLPASSEHRKRASSMASVVSDALASIVSQVLRSALLVFAFVLGAGGLVTAIGLSESAAAQVSTRLDAEALDSLIVRLPENWTEAENLAAVQKIADVHGVTAVARRTAVPTSSVTVTLLPRGSIRNQPQFSGLIVGGSSALADVDSLDVRPVQAVAQLDGTDAVAILGETAAASLGVSAVGPGNEIWIDDHRVSVVGIVSGGNRKYSNSVLLPYTFAAQLSGADPTIALRTFPGYPAPVADALPLLLSPSRPAAVRVETVADLRNLARGVSADFAAFVAAMSIAILVLASFSAATTIYLSVVGRTSEIALRRAVGASRSRVAAMFLAEGGLVGLAGGGAGAAVGCLFVVGFCVASGWSPRLDPLLIGLALGTGLVTGVVAALVPAISASRIDPAHAIRG